MSRLLHLIASPRPESYSTRVANEFVASYRQSHADDTVEVLDVFREEIPPFFAPAAKAKYAVMGGQEPKDEAQRAWTPVLKTIDHFKRFDKFVLSSAMWNFNIPYPLKQYIDVIVQPGLTFSYSPEKGYTGLVAGKPLMLILARGGNYGPGDPTASYDFQETYLRGIFGFIGFADIKTIYIQGTLQTKAEQIEAATRDAIAAARKAAAEF
ncbi:MAG: NAD(P)H-dependent oxidoreductase [Thermoguttaceae bacterium]